MRRIGFSSGALACADFRRALAMLHRHKDVSVIELSALRQSELLPIVRALDQLDLSQFTYIAFHAPSNPGNVAEAETIGLLRAIHGRRWPIVVHPDVVQDWSLWAQFGDLLCVENMDKRKPVGRTMVELGQIFEKVPNAKLCFDLGHVRQVDSTMTEAYLILKAFGDRLCQVHLSEVNTRSKHDPLSYASILAFQEVAHLIPENVPIVLETPVAEDQIDGEISLAAEALRVAVFGEMCPA